MRRQTEVAMPDVYEENPFSYGKRKVDPSEFGGQPAASLNSPAPFILFSRIDTAQHKPEKIPTLFREDFAGTRRRPSSFSQLRRLSGSPSRHAC